MISIPKKSYVCFLCLIKDASGVGGGLIKYGKLLSGLGKPVLSFWGSSGYSHILVNILGLWTNSWCPACLSHGALTDLLPLEKVTVSLQMKYVLKIFLIPSPSPVIMTPWRLFGKGKEAMNKNSFLNDWNDQWKI